MFKELNILKLFFENPTKEFGVRESAKLLKISPATSSKILDDFSQKDVLKKRKERNYILYKANLDSDDFRDIKVYYNINKIRNSGLISEINKIYLKPTIIFFGSGSIGMDVEESDIDLVLISENKKEFKEIKKFEKKLNRKIQIFVVKKLDELSNKHLINNVLNGTVLQGELNWV